jgi:hypothetical protein
MYFTVVMEDEKFQTSTTAFETKKTGALEFESTFGCRSQCGKDHEDHKEERRVCSRIVPAELKFRAFSKFILCLRDRSAELRSKPL